MLCHSFFLMASQLHENILSLFDNHPLLVTELLRIAQQSQLPIFAKLDSKGADFTKIKPTEYRADRVFVMYSTSGKPVLGTVIEVQLSRDRRKKLSWPVYSTELRARLKCPVIVLVVTPYASIERWSCMPIDLGGGNLFVPLVMGPSRIPVITELTKAKHCPELAILSSIAHAKTPEAEKIAKSAIKASLQLDEETRKFYTDWVMVNMPHHVQQALEKFMGVPANYQYQSNFAKQWIAFGKQEGKVEGRLEGKVEGKVEGRLEGERILVLKLLKIKFRKVSKAALERIEKASMPELELWAGRILIANTLDEVFASRAKS